MNPDGTIRHTYIPERQKIDQRPVVLTEGRVSKGGQNPPLEPGYQRPPAPQGSGRQTS